MDEILRKSWQTPKYDWEGWKKDLIDAINNDNERVLNIVNNEETKIQFIGFVWFNFTEENTLWLTSLVVDKKHQRKGIGSQVIFELESLVLKKNLKSIELGVQEVNKNALRFYQKNGFLKAEDIEYASTIVMRKTIDQKTKILNWK